MSVRKGILSAIGAYFIWGIFPIYIKSLQGVPALEFMLHRMVWSALLLFAILFALRKWHQLRAAITSWRILGVYAIAGLLLATNWLVYIYGVNSNQVVEASLGYFINPLVSVALGVIFLRERLRPLQWVPVGMAAAGVLYLTIQVGSLPWIALALAFSFGLYGLIQKAAPLGGLYSLTLETGVLFLPALAFLALGEIQGTGAFGHSAGQVPFLLAISGVVTVIPLLLFANAARSIPLWMVGILQYITPTGQFLLGVLLYNEPFTPTRLVGFGIIWFALLIFTVEGFMARRKTSALQTGSAASA